MADFQKQYPKPNSTQEFSSLFTSRRTFLSASTVALGALAVWGFRGQSTAAAAGRDQSQLPATVTIVDFGADGKRQQKVHVPTVSKPDAVWKQELSPLSYDVTRHAGTERAYTGNSWNLHDRGLFRCICCDTALFSSETKFDSGTGWPSFWQVLAKENVVERTDTSLGMERTEVSCKRCAAHLGHLFDDGPAPTGLRYCMNSAAMHFVKMA